MKITAFGAAEGVTGSKHLVEVNGSRVLLDCGMFQGQRKQSDFKNRHFPFDARSLDSVVLSHAHIDHSGLLPILAKNGFRGRVFATCATRDLCSIMLLDSANIQARDAEWLSKKNREFIPPLYADDDVHAIMRQFLCMPYGQPFEAANGVSVTLQDAGHVLGSAMVCLDCRENGATKRLLFTGDLGRKNMPILDDPWEPDGADMVVMESTYGDRDHEPIAAMEDKLAQTVHRAVQRGGKIIVPSFALERAQEIIYALKNLEVRGAIPSIPVYVDSPLTVNITEVFRIHGECFDATIRGFMEHAGDPFRLKQIHYVTRAEDSMRINTLREPAIIIAAAGMCEHGRILHHLKNNCEDPRNIILIVGFQAKNTLGRRIVERQPRIKIFGVEHPLNAEVRIMNGFSAHAGRSELLAFGKHFQRVRLVHGEQTALAALRTGLAEAGIPDVAILREAEPIEA